MSTSSIVQTIFSFWSFEISEAILRNQKYTIPYLLYKRTLKTNVAFHEQLPWLCLLLEVTSYGI